MPFVLAMASVQCRDNIVILSLCFFVSRAAGWKPDLLVMQSSYHTGRMRVVGSEPQSEAFTDPGGRLHCMTLGRGLSTAKWELIYLNSKTPLCAACVTPGEGLKQKKQSKARQRYHAAVSSATGVV